MSQKFLPDIFPFFQCNTVIDCTNPLLCLGYAGTKETYPLALEQPISSSSLIHTPLLWPRRKGGNHKLLRTFYFSPTFYSWIETCCYRGDMGRYRVESRPQYLQSVTQVMASGEPLTLSAWGSSRHHLAQQLSKTRWFEIFPCKQDCDSWQERDRVRLLQPTALLGVVDLKTVLILRVE